jgi:threonine/homoserine/homoserine lactone efflux protein
MDYLHHLLMVYAVYIFGTASPGPSNMTIMAVAMQYGRRPALTLAAGVMTGSLSWAALAATGLSAVLATYADALLAIKVCGGLYLLYLAWKSGRAALQAKDKAPVDAPHVALYRRGFLMHITNPKAIMSWLAVMSLGLQPDSPGFILPAILAGCAALGVTIFGGYAVLFSTAPMVRGYARMRRWIEGSLACLFSYAGLRLLLTRT